MKKPNFFIIGAPKCGTTSLAAWLGKHPQVYMSPIKETRYFSIDLRLFERVENYEQLFLEATDDHLAVGEASADYIFSEEAVDRILDYQPNARFVVALRDPAELVWAWHKELLFHDLQYEKDFLKAWGGRSRGPRNYERRLLDYKYVGALGSHLERLLSKVSRSAIHVILLDDVRGNPGRAFNSLLEFLGVGPVLDFDFGPHNVGRERRHKSLSRVVRVGRKVKHLTRIKGGTGILRAISKYNRAPQKEQLPEDTKAELSEYFSSDIANLENLMSWNLQPWKVKGRTTS